MRTKTSFWHKTTFQNHNLYEYNSNNKFSFTYYTKPSLKILPSKFSPYPYSNKIRIQNKTYKKQKNKIKKY